MIIVLDNRDSFVHNLARYIRLAGVETLVVRSNQVQVHDLLAQKPKGFVLSPGPGRPEDAGICIELIQQAPRIPILGVCLGHQCLANAYGGATLHAREPMHGRSSVCSHQDDAMFYGVPSEFQVGRYHSLAVKISDELRVTATSKAGEIMALRHRLYPHFGVQFHPESLLTLNGDQMIKNFVNQCNEYSSMA